MAMLTQVGTVEQYLEKGPGFIFLFHPALGPMWDVIAQKIRGGALLPGSELVLEVGLSAHPAPSSCTAHSVLPPTPARSYCHRLAGCFIAMLKARNLSTALLACR